ncbi:hypothetical protein MES5069_350023 [Mesorhizobium escarrei]|uniref:Uncharacterized protein n=1 Tax=Mesorhizobium escarrei TaxID=666018 RepID=A0ABN8K0V6_9HYPH|nr:hypothetical protein MES5069_350023 [Mesorhizobium escarrei]
MALQRSPTFCNCRCAGSSACQSRPALGFCPGARVFALNGPTPLDDKRAIEKVKGPALY